MSLLLSRTVLAPILVVAALENAGAQTLEVTAVPVGSAAKGLPLPVGATPGVAIAVRNAGTRAVGPVTVSVKPEGLAAPATPAWRPEGGGLSQEIARIAAGERVERLLRLKVERATPQPAKQRLRAEARLPGGESVSAELELTVADCVGAYREKLTVLRGGLLQNVRDMATALHRPDLTLPAGRLFPSTGARAGELANAERLAGAFAARHGGDPQMATEWFQFLILRLASELTAYSNQSPAPGLCANNYYQVAGYRQGLLPISNRIDAVHLAAERALAAAREATKAETSDEDLAMLVRRATAGLATNANGGETSAPTPLAALAAARGVLTSATKTDPDMLRALSLVETAAWLAETDRRGQALTRAVDEVLAAIGTAHKESCVCAF
jgi:hypothetical protein